MTIYQTFRPWPQTSTQKLSQTLQGLPKAIRYEHARQQSRYQSLEKKGRPRIWQSAWTIAKRFASSLVFRLVLGFKRLKVFNPGKSLIHSLLTMPSREHLLRDIGNLKKTVPAEAHPKIPLGELSNTQLVKVQRTLLGLKRMNEAKSWSEMKKGLETYLDLTGSNVTGKNCGPISLTHARRLSTGEFISAAINFHSHISGEVAESNLLFESLGFLKASPAAKREMSRSLRQGFLNTYGLQAPQAWYTKDIRDIEKKLLAEGSGAQVLIFDCRMGPGGVRVGHVSLAVNLRNGIFHINNLPFYPAVVSPLRSWGLRFIQAHLARNPFFPVQKALSENAGDFYYGIYQSRVMPFIAKGKPLNVTAEKKGGPVNEIKRQVASNH